MPETPQHELPFRYSLSEIARTIAFKDLDIKTQILDKKDPVSRRKSKEAFDMIAKFDQEKITAELVPNSPDATLDNLVITFMTTFDHSHKRTFAHLIAVDNPTLKSCGFSEAQLRFVLDIACEAEIGQNQLLIEEAKQKLWYGIVDAYGMIFYEGFIGEIKENKAIQQKLRERVKPTPPQMLK